MTPETETPALFRETAAERLERIVLGMAWALKPERLDTLPILARLWLKDLVTRPQGLPDPRGSDHPFGLVGMVRELTPEALLAAYRHGLYTFAHVGPLKWISTPTRAVLFLDEYHMGKRLRRLMRQDRYRVTFDQDFAGVIRACAGRREGKWHVTWITPRIMRAYAALFEAGHVHSFEVWNEAGALVGGGYGVALGEVFFTESQFSHEDNTSKLGFSVLNWHLAKWGYRVNDGKSMTPTIREMNFREIPRDEFLTLLDRHATRGGKGGRWSVETDPKTVAAWEPGAMAVAAE